MKSEFIKELNNFDTAEISDALDACGIEGALLGIKPIIPNVKIIGPAFTVKYHSYDDQPEDFKNAGNYIDEVPENAVVLIDNNGRTDCTTWGGILTHVALMRKLAGTVIFGAARDVSIIREKNYPLFTSAIYMRSGKNRVYKSDQQCDLLIAGVKICPGDIIVGDDNGVLVIPITHVEQVLYKAKNIKATEAAIIKSVSEGMKLIDARKFHRYDQPWLNTQDAK